MRPKPLATIALVALIAGLLSALPALAAASPPALAAASRKAAAHTVASAHAAASHGPTVSRALLTLLQSGAITQTTYNRYFNAYVAAKHSLGKLSGTRHEELGVVVENLQTMAAAGELAVPSRLPALFLTLERNRQWWTTEPLLANDERVSFSGSKLIWEHYPGQGIEIQWLATFGEGNGYFLAGNENANVRQLLGEIIPLATQRAGGIAWEYMFHFDGGAPPWTSGLSQGTALQLLARAYQRFKEPADLTAAQQALGIFQTPPPQGVRVQTPTGALYAEYTYAPSDRILNGFIQSLVGLYDYTSITKDPLGLSLFEAGDAEARALTPHYDTGAWSLYDQFGESNLNYHELLAEFLQHLCERTKKGPPIAPTTPPVAAPTAPPAAAPTTPSTTTGAPVATTATAAAATTTTTTAPAATPIAGDQIYCTTAEHFTADLHTPPVIALLTTKLRTSERGGVRISLSKVSTVRLTVKHGTQVVWSNTATVEGGKPRLLWVTPSKGGTFTVTLTATDLAGNFATATGTLVVGSH